MEIKLSVHSEHLLLDFRTPWFQVYFLSLNRGEGDIGGTFNLSLYKRFLEEGSYMSVLYLNNRGIHI